jgi:hypothetical protein
MSQHRSWTYKLPALGVDIKMVLDEDGDAFNEARRTISRDLREVTRKAATATVLPHVDRQARFIHTITGQGMVVRKGRSNSVYLTVLTRKRQLKSAVGYIEFGGKNKTPLLPVAVGPKSKQGRILDRKRRRSYTNPGHAGAVKLPDGSARAIVSKPRNFGGKKLIAKSIKQEKPAMQEHLKSELLGYFEAAGFQTTR